MAFQMLGIKRCQPGQMSLLVLAHGLITSSKNDIFVARLKTSSCTWRSWPELWLARVIQTTLATDGIGSRTSSVGCGRYESTLTRLWATVTRHLGSNGRGSWKSNFGMHREEEMEPNRATHQHDLALPDRVAAWLRAVGFERTELGVHFYDVLDGARRVEAELQVLLATNPALGSDDADRALSSLARLNTWLFTEVKHHIGELEHSWDELERRVQTFEGETDSSA